MRRAWAVAAGLLLAGAAAAADNGRTGAATLTRVNGALPAGLGGAFVAADGELDGAFYNPASLARLPDPKVQSTYQRGFADDSLGSIEYGHALGFGALYAGGAYYDAGTIDVNLSNGTQETRRAEQDAVGGLGGALGRNGPLAAGVVVKAYRLTLAEESHAAGAAADAGLLLRTPLAGLTLGAAVSNVGADVKFNDEGDPLPTTGRAGLAYTLDFARFPRFRDSGYVITVFGDAVEERRSGASGRGGLELKRRIVTMDQAGSVALRGGYASSPQTVTAGLGFRLGAFGLDYALNVIANTDNVHRLTVSWRFLPREEAPVIRGASSRNVIWNDPAEARLRRPSSPEGR